MSNKNKKNDFENPEPTQPKEEKKSELFDLFGFRLCSVAQKAILLHAHEEGAFGICGLSEERSQGGFSKGGSCSRQPKPTKRGAASDPLQVRPMRFLGLGALFRLEFVTCVFFGGFLRVGALFRLAF